MPSPNAYDFLRQSIAGQPATGPAGAPPATSTDSVLTAPEAADDELTDLTPEQIQQIMSRPPRPVPPILILPPGEDLLRFVNRVEQAHDLSYTRDTYLNLPDDDANRSAHAVDLMDEGIVFLSEGDFDTASDLFSLCVLLAPNYFYHFCLATARFHLSDSSGALDQLKKALDLIRAKQILPPDVAATVEQIGFVDSFYGLYVSLLLGQGRDEEARKMGDFILKQSVFQDPASYLELARQFTTTGDQQLVARFVERAMPGIEELEDKAEKARVLGRVQEILGSGSPEAAPKT